MRCATAGRPGASRLPADELADWLHAGGRAMREALEGDPRTPAWSFDPQAQTVGFWQRRQAMENVIHRVDVEQATGADTSVDAELATDGVGEVLDVMVRLRGQEGSLDLPPGLVRLHASDTLHDWLLGSGTIPTEVAAPAEQLFLILWRRRDATEITTDNQALGILSARLTP